jgi:four helix bundle protein
VIGRQLLRSATSVGANYRAACRGRSTSDVLAKLGIVEEEADESIYWLELLVDSHLMPSADTDRLRKEADELVAMTVASIKTLRKRLTERETQNGRVRHDLEGAKRLRESKES